MPPAKNQSAADEINALQKRQAGVRVKHAKKNSLLVMKVNPHLWVSTWDNIVAMGYEVGGQPFFL